MRKSVLYLLLMIFCLSGLYAANRKPFNYYFSHISSEDGLSESQVKVILQDSYGFMWFGTKNGLNRHDGTSIQTFNCDDYITGTSNHNISALFEDENKKLWVGTDRGVYIYDPVYDKFSFVNLKAENGEKMFNWVSRITSDHDGNIWVLIPDQGAFRYKDEKLHYYAITNKDNIKRESTEAICVKENGEVWIGTAGAGIGLPLARSLAMLHSGQLWLDTKATDNSFVLTLPLVQEKVRQQESAVIQEEFIFPEEGTTVNAEGRNYTLLLVEDNETMRSFLAEKLQELFITETAPDGKVALEILREHHIDIVVSDIMMPVMNGLELCKEIKADIELSHIPVIFLTAKNDLDSKINGLRLGAEAYVEKPFPFNYLATQIFSLLNNRQKEREAFSKRPFFPVNNMQMNKADKEFMDRIIAIIHENITDERILKSRIKAYTMKDERIPLQNINQKSR